MFRNWYFIVVFVCLFHLLWFFFVFSTFSWLYICIFLFVDIFSSSLHPPFNSLLSQWMGNLFSHFLSYLHDHVQFSLKNQCLGIVTFATVQYLMFYQVLSFVSCFFWSFHFLVFISSVLSLFSCLCVISGIIVCFCFSMFMFIMGFLVTSFLLCPSFIFHVDSRHLDWF